MLTAIFGDTHGHLNTMYYLAKAWENRTGLELELIIQVGDFGFWLSDLGLDNMTRKHQEKEAKKNKGMLSLCGDYPQYVMGERQAYKRTLVIRGNHEDQEYLMSHESALELRHPEDYLSRTIEMVPNIHYLPDGHITEVDGIRIGALGGCFSIKTFENWGYWDEARKKRVRYGEKRRLNHFTRDRWERLMREKFDVLLCHDAPTGMHLQGAKGLQLPADEMTEKIYNEFGCPYIRELVETVQPQHAFFGHWHQRRKEKIGSTQCLVLDKTDKRPSPHCMEVVDLQPCE